MNERQIATISDGYHAVGGIDRDGWYAAVLRLIDRDAEFTYRAEDVRDLERTLLPGKTYEQWVEASLDDPVRIVLARADGAEPIELARGLRVHPPVVPAEQVETPVVAWAEHDGDAWALRLCRNGEATTVTTDENAFPALAVCAHADAVYLAWESFGAGRDDCVIVADQAGRTVAELPGRNGVLRSAGEDLLVVTEQVADGRIDLHLHRVTLATGATESVTLPGADQFNTNADLLVHDGEARLLWETSPAWGGDPFIGAHRRLQWRIVRLGESLAPAAPELLPTSQEAFARGGKDRPFNLPPVFPRWIATPGGTPAVAFRRFRPDSKRRFGWDVLVAERTDAAGWQRPRRVSPQFGPSDSGYAVLPDGDGYVGLFPCNDDAGFARGIVNVRVEIHTFGRDCDLGNIPVPMADRGHYRIAPAVVNQSPIPPALPAAPGEYELIWGDLHRHSLQSKCMCPRDGSPAEGYRFCRDVLGCDVLALTDHHHHMGYAESLWGAIQLERAAAGGVGIFGTEPGISHGHHTNFYANTREIWEQARFLLVHCWDRFETYDAIRRLLPTGSLPVVRHVHGRGAGPGNIYAEDTADTFAADLEFAAETLQVRGSYLLDGDYEAAHRFPNRFLDAGAKLAILGGTDHTSGRTVNYFGLTGIWVAERTNAGVWDAIRAGRTLASANGRIAIWTTIAGQPTGSTVQCGGEVVVSVSVSSARPLRRIALLRDGEILGWQEIDGATWSGELRDPSPSADGQHWYLVAAQAESAYTEAGGQYDLDDSLAPWSRAFSSPFYVMRP